MPKKIPEERLATRSAARTVLVSRGSYRIYAERYPALASGSALTENGYDEPSFQDAENLVGPRSGCIAFPAGGNLRSPNRTRDTARSSGQVLKAFVMERLIERQVKIYDCMGLCESYKMRWTIAPTRANSVPFV